jgi:hypothetical protein
MKKIVLAFLAVVAVAVSSAEATTFKLQSYDVSLHTSGLGLQVWEKDVLEDPFTFQLNALTPSITRDLFILGTSEGSVDADDWSPYSIAVNFNFSMPSPGFGGNAEGMTGAISFLGHELGYVLWDNPLTLAFGTNGLMEIYLSYGAFSVPGWTTIEATFKLVRDSTGTPTSVPEPASALLMGMAAAVGIARRRRTGV